MPEYTIEELARFEWMPSRIPVQDALTRFIPETNAGPAVDVPPFARVTRYYPQEGGLRVLRPFPGLAEFDPNVWTVAKGAWDHDDCDFCDACIPAMTLCWVTRFDPYVLLCAACHARVVAAAGNA